MSHPINTIIDEATQENGGKRTIEERVTGHSIGWKINNTLEDIKEKTEKLDKLLHRPIDIINPNF